MGQEKERPHCTRGHGVGGSREKAWQHDPPRDQKLMGRAGKCKTGDTVRQCKHQGTRLDGIMQAGSRQPQAPRAGAAAGRGGQQHGTEQRAGAVRFQGRQHRAVQGKSRCSMGPGNVTQDRTQAA